MSTLDLRLYFERIRWTELTDRKALRNLLAEHFGFDLPEVETMRVPAIEGWS